MTLNAYNEDYVIRQVFRQAGDKRHARRLQTLWTIGFALISFFGPIARIY